MLISSPSLWSPGGRRLIPHQADETEVEVPEDEREVDVREKVEGASAEQQPVEAIGT